MISIKSAAKCVVVIVVQYVNCYPYLTKAATVPHSATAATVLHLIIIGSNSFLFSKSSINLTLNFLPKKNANKC